MALKNSILAMVGLAASAAALADDALVINRTTPVDAAPIILSSVSLDHTNERTLGPVDVNAPGSPFSAVASLFVGGERLATGVLISPRHILTAAHCFDSDSDGVNDIDLDVAVLFSVAGEPSVVIPPAGIERVTLHTDFTGFDAPAVNDDLAIITLSDDVPATIAPFALHRGRPAAGQVVWFIGYGETGDGKTGYTPGTGSFTVRRIGANTADAFFPDDEGSGVNEVWQYDFDAPAGSGWLGGPGLGARLEATLGSGDSGGPGFIETENGYALFSVNSFVSGPAPAGTFGSGGGGMLVSAYADWIDSVVTPTSIGDLDGDGLVSATDLRALLMSWGLTGTPADLDANGRVDGADLSLLLSAWGE